MVVKMCFYFALDMTNLSIMAFVKVSFGEFNSLLFCFYLSFTISPEGVKYKHLILICKPRSWTRDPEINVLILISILYVAVMVNMP